MTTLDRVRAALDHASIDYALIGAAALASYGVARSTFDVDLLTTDVRALDDATWAGLDADVRRGDVDDPLRGVIRISGATDRPVDVVVGKLAWQTRAVSRADRGAGDLPIVRRVDLVLLKLYAGGAQDLWDVRELLKAQDESLREEVSAEVQTMSKDMQRQWSTLTAEPL